MEDNTINQGLFLWYRFTCISTPLQSYLVRSFSICTSHKKRNNSLETRAVHIKIYMLCWNLASGPKHRDQFKIIWLALKGINHLGVTCMLFWIKQRLIYSKIQRNETENGWSNIKDPSTEIFQLQMPVLHASKCISKTGPSSLRQECGQNIKIKYLMSDSLRNIGTSYNSKLKWPNLKICVSELEKNY